MFTNHMSASNHTQQARSSSRVQGYVKSEQSRILIRRGGRSWLKYRWLFLEIVPEIYSRRRYRLCGKRCGKSPTVSTVCVAINACLTKRDHNLVQSWNDECSEINRPVRSTHWLMVICRSARFNDPCFRTDHMWTQMEESSSQIFAWGLHLTDDARTDVSTQSVWNYIPGKVTSACYWNQISSGAVATFVWSGNFL